MKKIKLSTLIFLGLIASSTTQAQSTSRSGHWCATDRMAEQSRLENPDLIQKQQELEDMISTFKQAYDPKAKKATIIVPVVVHNITHSGGQGYVTKQQIEAQLNTLNQDFNRTNTDATNSRAPFAAEAGSIDVEFRLAHIDPNGDCTEGIVRMESQFSNSTSTNMAENVKAVSYWSSQNYFNIWVIDEIESNSDGSFVAGYAQFPGQNNNGEYGVVVADQSWGAGNRTLTHELGHCLNLYHTFNYGFCGGGGDNCSDTPPVLESNFNCDPNRNTCSNDGTFYGGDVVDQWENYMSYSNCQNMFTNQQIARMMSIFGSTSSSSGVGQLSTTANLNATGTNDPYGPVICEPIAEFSYDKEYICEQASVTFTDDSYNATPTGWSWVFNGGTPGTSAVSSPTITYNNAGVYSVTHQPSTTAGSDVITKTNIITVSSLTADYVGPFDDSFESTTQFNSDWRIENISGGQTWQNTTTAFVTGTRSVRVRNSLTNTDGMVDELISPSYDISSAPLKQMKFKQAFAQKTSGNTDRLLVYYSIDCGATWTLKLPLTTATLTTAPNHSGSFVPTASEWVERTVDLTAIGSSTNVRFKFQFQSGGGNDIFIEDINIGGTVGIEENATNIGSINIYPNPANSNAKVAFSLVQDVKNLRITVKNTLGQNITNVINGQAFNAGQYTLNIDEDRRLSPGIYLVEFNADNNVKTQKLIIQ